MKIVFALMLLVVLVASEENDSDKIIEECNEELGVTVAQVIEYLLDDDADNDAKAAKYMLCYFKKEEVLSEDGHFDIEKAKVTVKNYMEEMDAGDDQEALNCVQQKDTPEETVLALAKCVEKRRVELAKTK